MEKSESTIVKNKVIAWNYVKGYLHILKVNCGRQVNKMWQFHKDQLKKSTL